MSDSPPSSDLATDGAQFPSAALPPETPETPGLSLTAAEDPYEGALPPGYDWPTHGGYLGCLLSLMASCLIGGFIGSTLFAALSCQAPIPGSAATLKCHPLVPGFVSVLLTLTVYVLCVVALGRLGWVLGKRFYREYPQTRRPARGDDDQSFAIDLDTLSPVDDPPLSEQLSDGAARDVTPPALPASQPARPDQ